MILQKWSIIKRENKNIIINTADNVYFVTATGYLQGELEDVLSLDENINRVEKVLEAR